MSEQNLCMGCMTARDYRAIGACPACGFEESEYVRQAVVREGVYLPLGTYLLDRQYILGQVLGHGGFSITYIARDESSQEQVAIKEYLPRNLVQRSPDNGRVLAYSDSDQDLFQKGLECFLEEARKLAELPDMPGLARVTNYFYENGTGYQVMDYLEGQSLESYLKLLGRRLKWEEALLFLQPVLATLNNIHATGMIHGDICPENIFVCSDGQIRLLGFGGAHLAYRDHVPGLTVVLRPGYTPLEQYSRKGGYGPFTDVYASAATLYRMVAGKIVPEASERLDEDPLPALLLQENWPGNSREALLKALALYPENRHASVAELAADLNAGWKREEGVPQREPLPGGAGDQAETAAASQPQPEMSEALPVAEDGDLLPSGYDAVMNNFKAGSAESPAPVWPNVYRRRKIVLLLIVLAAAILGLGAGNLVYTRYPQEVSAIMESITGGIQQFKFW